MAAILQWVDKDMARFVPEECLLLWDFERKKFLIAEVDLTFLRQSRTEARIQDSDRKQEFDRQRSRKKLRRRKKEKRKSAASTGEGDET